MATAQGLPMPLQHATEPKKCTGAPEPDQRGGEGTQHTDVLTTKRWALRPDRAIAGSMGVADGPTGSMQAAC